jgi:hypothetical protein
MYFITAIVSREIKERKYLPRTFGFSGSLKTARRWVNDNVCDMHECLYDHIVIENIGPGIHPETKQEWWYKWNGGRWMICKKPDWSVGRVNWALG